MKAAKFFLVCESHIDPDMRVKIPAAMMAKGYSNEESKNRTLQMQVYWEVEKIRGLDPPRPPEAVAAAATASPPPSSSSSSPDLSDALLLAVSHKESGNRLFKSGDYAGATWSYPQGANVLKKLDANNAHDKQVRSVLVALQTNPSTVARGSTGR